ncbi:copper resistance D family protein [Fodinicola acaciae]|uniref:copper resistance D family protein n=1 Tax=Fodinicola acaciae TaxID=2681555 RepID=UPI001C9E273A|nr:CopD family protein [Fodinicola acaciae]
MTRDDTLHAFAVLLHVTGYLALAILAGGLLFVSALWPAGARDPRTRLILTSSVAVGVASAIGTVLLAAQYATSGPAIEDVLTAPFGRVAAASGLLWLLAAVVVVAVLQRGERAVRSLPWRAGALAVAFGLLRATGMSGHSNETAEAGLSIVADFLHLAGVSAWLGGLTVLSVGLLPRRRADEIGDVAPKFSRFAMVSVLAIVASGLIMAWQIVGSVGALVGTAYGHLLLTKLAVFALVLLAAMMSKHWVENRLSAVISRHASAAVRPFVLSVGAETVLAVAVLVAASVLVTASPGH